MIQYLAIRTISVILGLCSMVVALFVFVLDLVASLNNVDPTNDYLMLGLIVLLIVIGGGTMAAPIFIFKEQLKKYLMPTFIVVGIGYAFGYFMSLGAINTIFEILLMAMAILYFSLAYLVHRFTVE